MSNLRCKICKSTDVTAYTPGIFGESRHKCNSCGEISSSTDFVEPTVFNCITQSPEVLAKSSVYCLSSDLCRDDDGKFTVKRNWKSPFIDRCYGTEEEAIAATVEKFKEVCNGNQ